MKTDMLHKTSMAVIAFSACAALLAGCTDESHAEELGEKIDEGLENAGDAIEDGVDAAEDAVNEGAEAVEEATDGQ